MGRMDLFAIFGMTPDAQRRRTEAVVRAVHNRWSDEAPDQNYRDSLSSETSDDESGQVVLGFPGVFKERGAPPRNISEAMLRSPAAKVSKKTGARYMSIKMRDGEWRTTSSAKPPWMTKGKPGAGVIVKVRRMLPEIVAASRGER